MTKIKWSPLAETQLIEILKFYTNRNGSPSYSKRLKKEIVKVVRIIRANRYFGEQLSGHNNQRRVSVGNFVLVYELVNGDVRISSLRDGRRNEEWDGE